MIRIFFWMNLLLLPVLTTGQEWFPIGATWHYSQVIFFQGDTYVTLRVSGEMIVDGRTCRVIEGGGNCVALPCSCVYEENDIVYGYDDVKQQFVILYDFTLVPGDTLHYHTAPTGDSYFRLDSVTSWDTGIDTLRVQHFSWLSGQIQLGNRVYERIGSNGFLFPVDGVCDPATGGLRCYEDPYLDSLHFFNPELPCDYSSITIGTDEPAHAVVTVFPNPASHSVSIASTVPLERVGISSLLSGNEIYYYTDLVLGHEIDITHLPEGFYVLRVTTATGENMLKKMVIAR